MPVKSLNALRRDALQALYDKICTGFHRDIRQADLSTDNITVKNTTSQHDDAAGTTDNPGSDNVRPHRTTGTFSHLSVSVQTRAQLIAALSHSVCDDIYIDSMCYTHKSFASLIKEDASHIHGTGKKAYLMLPLVFRKSTENFYRENISVIKGSGIDGIVVKSIDALQFAVSEISLPIICDHSIYNWNRESNDVLLRYNVIRTTAPLELNRSELYRLSNDRCEIMVYGYYPLMTSAQCVHANVSHCDKKPSTVYLKDRYGKYFPVKNNCADCVNTVYNTVPAMLFSNIREFKKMGFYGGRIAFSIEDERAVHAILDMYGRVTDDPGTDLSHIFKNNDYTNGHFKRGVE
jgi:putative protease